MKKSIKKRVAGMFILIIGLTLAAIGVFHYILVERLYTADKQQVLIDSYELLNEAANTNDGEKFGMYCSRNGLVFALADENFNFIATNSGEGQTMVGRMFGSVMDMENENTKVRYSTDSYEVVYFTDEEIDYLQLFGHLDNGYYYVVRYPMDSIKYVSALSFKFYVLIGCIMMAISTFVIVRATRRLTEPVEELNALSKRMADLDFEAKYTSGGEDEIGQLGANFNTMSNKLEYAISELKTANAKLESDIREKEEIDERRREFLSNVSHDLKTPIALIQGYAEGLKEIAQDAESRNYYCDVIIDEAGRMNRLVRQLLSLDNLESGDDKLDMTRFNISELIRSIVSASDLMIQQAGAEVVIDCPEEMYVWGDEMMIEEVVTNYFSNALHYVCGEMKIHITCKEDNGVVTTSVFNTGNPIPENELDKIWTKFYKVDKARTRQYGGSGIGLSIVKAIMNRHGQRCWAENYQNGVAFKFTLSSR